MFHVQPTVEGEDEQDDEIEEPQGHRGAAAGRAGSGPRAPAAGPVLRAHAGRGGSRTRRAGTLAGGSARDTDPKYANVARNAQCPCGSGRSSSAATEIRRTQRRWMRLTDSVTEYA